MERIRLALLSVVFGLLLLSTHALAADTKGGYSTRETSAPSETIFSKAVSAGSHGLFLSAVEDAGLAYLLDAQGPYTVFLPTDDAISSLPPGTWARLTDPANRDQLRAVLEYHILPGSIKATEFDNLNEVDTLFGRPMRMSWYGGNRRIGGAASIVGRDMMASNGFYHSVDSVLLPPNGFEVIADADEFGIFNEAVRVAGIVDELEDGESYTIIVPRDSAFANMPEEDIDVLFQPENRNELRAILNHYVLRGDWTTDELLARRSVTTIADQELELMADGRTLMVNDVRVVEDIPVYNGRILVVDEVIYPDTAVAGSFMQIGDYDNDRFYSYGDDYDGEKCYFDDYDRDVKSDYRENKGWKRDRDHDHDSRLNSDGCGCGDWHGKSWSSHRSGGPEWWSDWAY